MSVTRRNSDPLPGASLNAPAVSPLGVPEVRSRQSAIRSRRQARNRRLARRIVYGVFFGAGVLAGLLTARAVALRSHAAPPSERSVASDRAMVTVHTLDR